MDSVFLFLFLFLFFCFFFVRKFHRVNKMADIFTISRLKTAGWGLTVLVLVNTFHSLFRIFTVNFSFPFSANSSAYQYLPFLFLSIKTLLMNKKVKSILTHQLINNDKKHQMADNNVLQVSEFHKKWTTTVNVLITMKMCLFKILSVSSSRDI